MATAVGITAAAIALGFVGLQIRNVVTDSPGCNCYGTVDRSLHPVLALVRATIVFVAAAVLAVTSAAMLLVGRVADGLVGVLAGATVLGAIALTNQALNVIDFDRRRNELITAVRLKGVAT